MEDNLTPKGPAEWNTQTLFDDPILADILKQRTGINIKKAESNYDGVYRIEFEVSHYFEIEMEYITGIISGSVTPGKEAGLGKITSELRSEALKTIEITKAKKVQDYRTF